jgi:hypothetical protein
MPAASHVIHINARVETIWATWEDIANWKTWSPTMSESEPLDDAIFGIGKRARLNVRGGGSGIWMVTLVEPGRRFVWENDSRGVHSLADHIVAPSPDGGSDVTTKFKATGLMATLLGFYIGKVARDNLRDEAAGFKAYCESL